jgi:hypothetical protein
VFRDRSRLRRARSLRSEAASVARTKDRFKHFSRLNCAARQKPHAAFRPRARVLVYRATRSTRTEPEPLVTSNELAEKPDVLSHRVKVLPLAGHDRAICHRFAQPRTGFVNDPSRGLSQALSSIRRRGSTVPPAIATSQRRLVDLHPEPASVAQRSTRTHDPAVSQASYQGDARA